MVSATELLREYGLRVTPQRVALVEIIREMPAHFAAEDVHQRIAERFPTISVVSVYRGLETLRRLGLVSRTEVGAASAAYEWSQGHRHHHLICTNCGGVAQFDDSELTPLREQLLAHHGFRAAIDHYAIFGLCRPCAADANRAAAGDGDAR